ncbi:MAG: histidine decarboxylase [Plesiomonas sp.]|uniref:histidine decarboxylase n=1 Tax=Plesiomonas sp. TaxID=2486279 RepID=UPI003F31F07F
MSLSIKDQNTLDKFWAYCVKNQYFNLGYPESADFDYTILERFLRFSINNCGDWSEYCNYLLNSFDFEKEVIEHFSQLYQIPFEKCWGYVTNGGTEGNMFGCYLARELFPSSRLYFSKDTHYSVAKIVKLLRIDHCIVESTDNGEMDYDDLISRIKANNEKHPIIFANIGTTVRGAIDNINIIQNRIAELGIARKEYYIHADAALSGMILPFVDEPQPYNFVDGIDSISVSGHKMIGSPIPCGIAIAKKENVDKISVEIDYIAAHDKTITGSRNGHTPIMLWVAAKSISIEEQRRRIQRCLHKAEYAVKRFNDAGIPAWRNKNSITVVFPKPSEYVWKKHCLAISGDVAHMITSAHHLDTTKIDALIDDVIADSMAMVI